MIYSYVRDNYYDYGVRRRQTVDDITTTQSTSDIKWASYVYEIMKQDYVPMELFRGDARF